MMASISCPSNCIGLASVLSLLYLQNLSKQPLQSASSAYKIHEYCLLKLTCASRFVVTPALHFLLLNHRRILNISDSLIATHNI
jgi:hypothetical protein